MSVYYHSAALPWTLFEDEERRFQRILRTVMLLSVLAAVAMPFLPRPEPELREQVAEPEKRLVKLLFEKKVVEPKPKPKIKPKPVPPKVEKIPKVEPKPQPVAKPKPKPQPKAVAKAPDPDAARRKAASSGLLAMQDTLADMRNSPSTDRLRSQARLSTAGSTARQVERAMVTSQSKTSSGGINTAALSRESGDVGLASRGTTKVAAVASTTGNGGAGSSGAGRGAGRSMEEIQRVFDRNKGAIYGMYNRELRRSPGLQGKLVLRLTIAPDGKVTTCELVSSELESATLTQKLVQRVKMFDFGAKSVDSLTITYPIEFLPA